ncbi:MAG: DUF2656 family protein [Cyanobacteria bacterium P01_F01_bin.150]
MTRLLLSHNHNIPDTLAPALSNEEFCEAFATALSPENGWTVTAIPHPHWRCAITTDKSAQEVGPELVNALISYRQTQLQAAPAYKVLALGGLKSSPPTSDNPNALQTGDWGVDVVETVDVKMFLTAINWDALSAARPADGVFKVIS